MVQISTDGNSWSDVTFPGYTVGAVEAVHAVDSGQFEVVVSTLPNCETTVLRSYTSGEFWKDDPSSLASWTWLNVTTQQIYVDGVAVTAPCSAPHSISRAEAAVLLACSDGLYAETSSAGPWARVLSGNFLALGSPTPQSRPLLAIAEDADCAGAAIYGFDSDTQAAARVACVELGEPVEEVAIASNSRGMFLWDGVAMHSSVDGGRTWRG